MTTYLTREGDVLDALCWRYYGREDVVTKVLDTNPGLAEQGPVLVAGIYIRLPDVKSPVKQLISLWD